jgi:hypothetical protein
VACPVCRNDRVPAGCRAGTTTGRWPTVCPFTIGATLRSASYRVSIQAATLTVAWPVAGNTVAEHLRMVPVLLRWCRWERDAGWSQLRRTLAQTRGTPTGPAARPLRLARVLDFVGCKARTEGCSPAQIHAQCQQTADAFAAGQVRVEYDPEGGAVRSVTVVVDP